MSKQQSNTNTHFSLLTEQDIYLFREGNHFRLYEKLGAHIVENNGVKGVYFAVWAPNAKSVSVIGDFNDWDNDVNSMNCRWDGSGIWEAFVPEIGDGAVYKYHIVSHHKDYTVDKGDPFAFYWEQPPRTASVVKDLNYKWKDSAWKKRLAERNCGKSPMSVYEVHLGSWKHKDGGFLSYAEMADELVKYVKETGFTHVEFLPVMEHPFYGSWGYQTLGYFAPSCRFGECEGFMELVDKLHQNEIGVILDWVPSHFPNDEHGLVYFDGTHLYEHSDPKKGFHPDWKSCIFNYGRKEVRSFLISSAFFWLDKYHADGLRVDAVASMLYLDYSRNEGEWIPNENGGRENLEAIDFLRRMNEMISEEFPDATTIAEESTSWPMVTGSVDTGGLGFDMKWNMGWMHDTLDYMRNDPVHRKFHQDKLSFSIWYAFTERFVLPLSHDEVVHGKGSIFNKMPGDEWQKFANLRLLYGYMFTHPGKKLLFMGSEFGQPSEWNHDWQLDWGLLDKDYHAKMKLWTGNLNWLYKSQAALHQRDFHTEGFEWIDFHDMEQSVISYLRYADDKDDCLAVVCNFTPVPRYNYRIGVPKDGFWKEVMNSDAKEFGGSGQGNMGGVEASPAAFGGRFDHSLSITLPPLGIVAFKRGEK
ncbi:1,4-alpha-glucan branching enzyme GlgB [Anaerohalosphaera lusitana]|uniref:1,4-alpha-glucan branching enzyme GlgB n=1 Tax=Anaerohalosphaera lusitana TaxID=1936003 RepID=A0A1U9NKW3_9BACT|nr:1,4-alpha-glucan branching protein GlgB [Anaerohalosphaera lusitana]AQT68455.1 1,4-alpha-glucan branching enzyme GlgB [Anaerohalosphaera lusitana]